MLYDVIRIQRVFFGVRYSKKSFEWLYNKKFPLISNAKKSFVNEKIRKVALNALIFVQDIFFCIACAVSFLVLTYYENDGMIRALPIITLFLGFVCYYFSFAKLVMLFSEAICFFIKIVIAYLCYFIVLPLRLIWRLLKKLYLLTYSSICGKILKVKIKRFSAREQKRVLRMSRVGFIDS